MCSECVQSLFRVCSGCVQSVLRVYSECAESVLRVCSECAQSVFNIEVISSTSASSVSIFGIFYNCPVEAFKYTNKEQQIMGTVRQMIFG